MDVSTDLNTPKNVPSLFCQTFEIAWRCWRSGAEPPCWEQFLPADGEGCCPEAVLLLVKIDLEFRAKGGLPGLLTVRHLEHCRLVEGKARLGDEAQIELVRWDYQQRWQNGRRPRRADYQAAFPRHAAVLGELGPRCRCPACRRVVALEETDETARCPACGTDVTPAEKAPAASEATASSLDLRGYALAERLGAGGMGEVYRAADPALGRDLAVKVMKADYQGNPEAEGRFLREARVTGSLQHPGIVPVHNLGRMADGRLHYTMRLVRGRTLADILAEEAGKPERRGGLLAIFEKVCQAVAYAHSKRVIHRDLKPANVMVGGFGEVQVMDWGLAKVLTSEKEPAPEGKEDGAGTRLPTELAEMPAELSRTGAGMGTPAYMPPEQARGEWDAVDERADVFALGAILCEVLTGCSPYGKGEGVLTRVRRGDVSPGLEALGRCGADAELAELCRECLTAAAKGRPRHAGAVAERLTAYQAEVQERLRRAEVERAAAEARAAAETERAREARARARAERRAQRRTLALAATVVLLLAAGGGGWWWRQFQQEQTDREALAILERAGERLEEGWRQNDLASLAEAKAETERAASVAHSGGAGESVGRRIAAFQAEVRQRLARAERNRDLLDRLRDVATPHETRIFTAEGPPGTMLVLAEPSEEDQFASAFRRRWPEIDLDKLAASEAAARLQEEPEGVVEGVIAGLDAWTAARRRQERPEAEWRSLLGVVERLDHSESRRQLRALLAGEAPPRPEDVAGLLGGGPPWPALWELGRGNAWRQLRQLRGRMDPAVEPVLTVLLLARTTGDLGDLAGAEEVLRRALARHPEEVALLDALGKVLERQDPPRLAEAIGFYRAARARQPRLGVALARALEKGGQAAEGEDVLRDLLRRQPNNPEVLVFLGIVLYRREKYAEAEAAYRRALALQPDHAEAHFVLGIALFARARFAESLAAFQRSQELGSKQPGWRFPALDMVRTAERGVELEKTIARGGLSVFNLGDALDLAEMYQLDKRHAAAARLYADAFAAARLYTFVAKSSPILQRLLRCRDKAARSAALAAAGEGEDARMLPDKVALTFRRWSLEWLRADLRDGERVVRQGNAAARAEMGKRLRHWRGDPDLASVRDGAALDRLPETERAAWRELWGRVDELLEGLGATGG